MLNYYCLIIIGDNSGVDDFLTHISNRQQNTLLMDGFTIFTFETSYDIKFIDDHLMEKNYLLSRINDLNNFSANMQSKKFNDQLFGDYIDKKIKEGKDFLSNKDSNYIDFEELKNSDEVDDGGEIEDENHFPPIQEFNDDQIKLITVDELLDKINLYGIDKLSKFELSILDNYAKKSKKI